MKNLSLSTLAVILALAAIFMMPIVVPVGNIDQEIDQR